MDVTFTITEYDADGDVCEEQTCNATFEVDSPPELSYTCPADTVVEPCLTATELQAAYDSWLDNATDSANIITSGGCNIEITHNAPELPDFTCEGGTVDVTFTITEYDADGDVCEEQTCNATFEVDSPPELSYTCPADTVVEPCLTATELQAAYDSWLDNATDSANIITSGGCNIEITHNAPELPDFTCEGGTVDVTFTITEYDADGDVCEEQTCNATFEVDSPPELSYTCPADTVVEPCLTATELQAAYDSWLDNATDSANIITSGGCNIEITHNAPELPDFTCEGGTVDVTFTITEYDADGDVCEEQTCNATFEVDSPPELSYTCPADTVVEPCLTATELQAAYDSWLDNATDSANIITSGGCNIEITHNAPELPDFTCEGGTVDVTFTITEYDADGDVCEEQTCNATFEVDSPPELSYTCPADTVVEPCLTATELQAAYDSWLDNATDSANIITSGGCNIEITHNAPELPDFTCEGGTVDVTFTITEYDADGDVCEEQTCNATFEVDSPPELSYTCPADTVVEPCLTATELQAAYDSWLDNATDSANIITSGGCNIEITHNAPELPDFTCEGGTVDVTFTITEYDADGDVCEEQTCNATFEVDSPPELSYTCPADTVVEPCLTATELQAAYDSWLDNATDSANIITSSGCNIEITHNAPELPDFTCEGGTVDVTFTITEYDADGDVCEEQTCNATFEVDSPPELSYTCPADTVVEPCLTATELQAAYDSWLDNATDSANIITSGGCNIEITHEAPEVMMFAESVALSSQES